MKFGIATFVTDEGVDPATRGPLMNEQLAAVMSEPVTRRQLGEAREH